jgi:hypothetical protein
VCGNRDGPTTRCHIIARAQQIDTEHEATWWQDKLADEQAAIETPLTEQHCRKSALEAERR